MRASGSITCATEVFLALCLLHREHPEREDFSVREIVARAALENLNGTLRPGVQVHASLHCVANRPPNPLAHSMIYATGKSTRRLLRSEDDVHPKRNQKHWPSEGEVPSPYLYLLHEAQMRFATPSGSVARKPHPLTRLVGLGAEIWKGIDPDQYIRGLREGWD